MRLNIEADGVWLEMETISTEDASTHFVGLDKRPSPNFGQSFQATLPDTIVLHYTAGGTADALQVLSNADGTNRVSAHFVVNEAGWIWQLVSLDRIAWHAGVSEWDGRKYLNQYSIGIEMVNPGKLQAREGSWYTWWGKEWPDYDIFYAQDGTGWGAYPDQQTNAVMALCQVIARELPISVLVGHEEISPGRKEDPGPAFASLDSFRDVVLAPVNAGPVVAYLGSVRPMRRRWRWNEDLTLTPMEKLPREPLLLSTPPQEPAAVATEAGEGVEPQDTAKPVRERLSAVLDALKALGPALSAILAALRGRDRS